MYINCYSLFVTKTHHVLWQECDIILYVLGHYHIINICIVLGMRIHIRDNDMHGDIGLHV